MNIIGQTLFEAAAQTLTGALASYTFDKIKNGIYKENSFGIWIDSYEGKMFVSKDIDPSYPIIYSITMKDHSPNTLFLRDKSRAVKFKVFMENYKLGNVRFENINIKNITYEVIQLCMYKF